MIIIIILNKQTYVVYYSSNIDTDYVDDNKAIVIDDDAKDTSAIPTGDDDYEAYNPQYAPGKLLLGNESYDDSGNDDSGDDSGGDDIDHDSNVDDGDDDVDYYLSLSVFCR